MTSMARRTIFCSSLFAQRVRCRTATHTKAQPHGELSIARAAGASCSALRSAPDSGIQGTRHRAERHTLVALARFERSLACACAVHRLPGPASQRAFFCTPRTKPAGHESPHLPKRRRSLPVAIGRTRRSGGLRCAVRRLPRSRRASQRSSDGGANARPPARSSPCPPSLASLASAAGGTSA